MQRPIIGRGRAGQGRARQGRAGQGRAGQGRAGQGRAGQDRAGQGSDLRPTSRQVQRVSLVACCVAASPPDITGLISSMKTSHSSYCQKLYTACTSPKSLASQPQIAIAKTCTTLVR